MHDTRRVIYEVNLSFDPAIAVEFDDWLTRHVAEMLALPGFQSARILSPDRQPGDEQITRTTQYELDDRAALDRYLDTDAERMRADGVERFGDRFSASRRILEQHSGNAAPNECLNCGTPLSGRYCSFCGQRATTRLISLWQLIRDALGDLLDVDSRIWRSLSALIRRPGQLTADYLSGRRARYLPPFRLYLLLSLTFFVVAFFDPSFGLSNLIQQTEPAQVNATKASGTQSGLTVSLDLGGDNEESGRVVPTGTVTEVDCKRFRLDPEDAEDEDLIRYFPPERTIALCERLIRDNFRGLLQELVSRLPMAMFVFLPALALILKLLYPLSRRYYVEHLLFILNFQSLGFLVSTLVTLTQRLGEWLSPLAALGNLLVVVAILYVPAYLYLALRHVYGQGRAATLIKYVLLIIAYFVFAFITLAVTLTLSLLSV